MLRCALALLMSLAAYGDWLDKEKPDNWNTGDSAIPKAPTMRNAEMASRCDTNLRPPTLAVDKLLTAEGWRLFGAAEVFGDLTVVRGFADYDGMCRPFSYQGFVFYKGKLAGTLSPRLMDARTDASLKSVTVSGIAQISAEFVRYTEKDPLCCPSANTGVFYEMDLKATPPHLKPVAANTSRLSTP